MKRKAMVKIAGFATFILLCATTFNLSAAVNDVPNTHPAYLHALTDLRAARWMLLYRPGNWKVTENEITAIKRIDMAIAEIKKASIDDGKDIYAHPKVEERPDRPGRLHAAAGYLLKAMEYINKENDKALAKGLKVKTLDHITAAIGATENAIKQ